MTSASLLSETLSGDDGRDSVEAAFINSVDDVVGERLLSEMFLVMLSWTPFGLLSGMVSEMLLVILSAMMLARASLKM